MSEKIAGNFHEPHSEKHPEGSIGNQQLWDRVGEKQKVKQVGSIEYFPNTETGNLDLSIFNTKGDKFTDL